MLDLILKLKSELEPHDEFFLTKDGKDAWAILAEKYENLHTGYNNCIWDLGDGTILRWRKGGILGKLENFLQPYIELTKLNLPFIPKLLQIVEGPTPYTIIEKVDGAPLKSIEKLAPAQIASIKAMIQELHKNGFTHGDLKGGNIIIGENIWLIDFDSLSTPGDFAQFLYKKDWSDLEKLL